MDIVNSIGLEGEFILRDGKTKEIVYPRKYGFSSDEYIILGEFRAPPGTNRAETVGNFLGAIAQVIHKAEKQKLAVDFSGVAEISAEMKAEVVERMGYKTLTECQNIYHTNILQFSDDVVVKGKLVKSHISAGLHVHFSRMATQQWIDQDKKPRTSSVSLLTNSQRNRIIRTFDRQILPGFDLGVPLKYRQPGFYEMKPWGFEYRSLPMVWEFLTIKSVMNLVDFAFTQLEKLEK